MESTNGSYISLIRNISELTDRVKQKTGYQWLSSVVKNGGVYISHTSDILVCYATILPGGKLDKEIYTQKYEEPIHKKDLGIIGMSDQVEKETLDALEYHKMIEDQQKALSEYFEQQRKSREEYLKYKQENMSKRKIKRKRTVKLVGILLVSLATLLLVGLGKRKEIVTRRQQYALIMDYVGEDTNILNQHTSRINHNKDYQFHNAAIATAIMETGKNPWPLLSDLLSDMGIDKGDNFSSVVDYLYSMDYFPYDYETLVITANAKAKDGSCDFNKLSQYIRERAVYIITELRIKTMTKEEKDELYSFLNYFRDYIGEVETLDSSKGMGI